jgi:hypothetical protein
LKKNANFFRRKLAQIAEISDHNIDPLVKLLAILPQSTAIYANKIITTLFFQEISVFLLTSGQNVYTHTCASEN